MVITKAAPMAAKMGIMAADSSSPSGAGGFSAATTGGSTDWTVVLVAALRTAGVRLPSVVAAACASDESVVMISAVTLMDAEAMVSVMSSGSTPVIVDAMPARYCC